MSSGSRPIQLALVQQRCVANVDTNIESAADAIARAAGLGAQIVCLQEVFSSLYPCQSEDHRHFDLAEPIPGPCSDMMQSMAREHDIVVTGSIFERRTHGLYHNTAVVYDAGGELAGMYRKMHIPDDPLFYEKFYFTPGDTGFTVAKTRYATLGVGVCWDQWYPEAARLFSLAGAEILLYPTAIGWSAEDKAECGSTQHSSWETMMRSHAIANGVFVAAPNRVGVEDALEFWGQSFGCDPSGTVQQRGSATDSEIVLVECDLTQIDVTRTHWPFLRDRRIDAYGDLTRRFIDS